MKEEKKRGEYKGFTDARKRANDKYMSEKVDSLSIYVPRGKKDTIKTYADNEGLSLNQFVNRAIDNELDRIDQSGSGV